MSSPDIPGLVQRLRKTYRGNKTRPLEWRKQQLRQIEKMFKDNESQFKEALKKDLGHKTRFFVEVIELSQIYEEVKVALENLDQWVKPEAQSTPIMMQPGSSFVLPEPLGVVLIISPWNYPLSLLICPLIGAIAAGNCAVMKPSEVAPANSNLLAKLVPQYLDKDAITVVEGAVEETTELLRQKWDYIFYTGNGTVGKIILRAAAENLTPCTLELGGKSPCVVDSTANLDVTANRILWGKYINVGQTCVAPDYLLVEKSIEKPLLEKLKQGLKKFYGENPQKSEDYSRIVNQRHTNRLNTLLERAKKENVEIFTGGTVDVNDCYIAPTIIRNVKRDSVLMEDEIFGPLLPILTIDSLEEAISFINSREKPLAAYLYSNDKKNQDSFLQYVTSGGGCINDNVIQVGNGNLPFGGVGPSGMGAYHGKHSFHLFSHHKAVIAKGAGLDLDLRYPPYTETKLNRLAFVKSIHIPRLVIVATAIGGLAAIGYAILRVPAVKEILVTGLKAALDFLQ